MKECPYPARRISIHAPHEGERPLQSYSSRVLSGRFQSTLPTRGSDAFVPCADCYSICPQEYTPTARRVCAMCRLLRRNFNPRSPRGGATRKKCALKRIREISIHAPHEGERPLPSRSQKGQGFISIHAPHEGERLLPSHSSPFSLNFNPRSPRGGATTAKSRTAKAASYFNPRSPRGGATIGR